MFRNGGLSRLLHLQCAASFTVALGVGIQCADGWKGGIEEWVRGFHGSTLEKCYPPISHRANAVIKSHLAAREAGKFSLAVFLEERELALVNSY